MSYDAFISYAHGVDGVLAESIQRELGRLARPWHRRVALRVFRDATSLSAAPGLWTKLTATMDETAWFVLIASPAAASSLWVNREAAYWLESHGPDQVILVLADGSMRWDPMKAQFDPVTSTALPAALIDAFSEEPLFIDVRDERDATGTRDEMFRGCVAQIAAPIHGVSKEDLFGEEARQQKRTVRLVKTVIATLAALSLLATSAGFLAIRSAHSATQARIQSDNERRTSDYERLLAQSRSLRGTDPTLSLLLALQATRARNTQTSRNVLQGALVASGPYLSSETDRSKTGTHNALCMLDPYRVGLVADSDGTVTFIDSSTARPVGKRMRLPGWNKTDGPAQTPVNDAVNGAADLVMGCAVSPDRRRAVVFSRSGLLWRVDLARRAAKEPPIRLGVRPNQVAVSATSQAVLVGSTDGQLLMGSFDEPVARWERTRSDDAAVGVAFSPDGATAASTTRDEVVIWNPANWSELSRLPAPPDDEGGGLVALEEQSRLLTFSPDNRLLGDSRRDVLRLFDLDQNTARWSYTYPSGFDAQPFAFTKNAVLFSGLSSSFLSLDLENGQASPTAYDTHNADLQTFAVSSDGRTLFSAPTGGHTVQRFALDGRRSIARFIHAPGMQVAMFSPDGTSALLSPSGASFVVPSEVIDVATGRSLGKVPTAGQPHLMSRTTVEGYFVDELMIDRFDATTSSRIGPNFPIDISRIAGATAAFNGEIAITNRGGTVDVYGRRGTPIGTPWLRLPGDIKEVHFSRDGGQLAVERSNGRVNVYQLAPRRLVATMRRSMDHPTFTPDGNLLAGFTKGGNAFTFADATTGKPVGADLLGNGSFSQSDFPPGPRFLLNGDEVGQVYDRTSRAPIGETLPSTSPPFLRPGGDLVATSTPDGIVLWDFDQSRWAPIACRIVGRNLTRAEWKTYLPSTSYRRTCTRWPSGR